MTDNISSTNLIVKVYKWRKTFIWVTVLTAIITSVILLIIPNQYKSTAILFPARQFSVSKLVIEANAGNQEDYMEIGDEDDCEKLMQIVTTDELKLEIADHFNLWKRWNIKDTSLALHYLKQKWWEMVTIKRTEYNSIKIEALDYTPGGAAEIANGIAEYADSIRWHMIRPMAASVLKIVKDEYDSTVNRMKALEDSLDVLRKLGVLHYKEQVKAYSKSYARAIEKNDLAAMKRLEGKLDTLKKYGGAYQNVHDNLEKYGAKYPDIRQKYEEALVNYTKMIPMKEEVERAKPNAYRDKPRRLLILALVLAANNIIALAILLLREKLKTMSFR